jgi:FtsP/CotA-like multicopper oxidase with cupredoxin domain
MRAAGAVLAAVAITATVSTAGGADEADWIARVKAQRGQHFKFSGPASSGGVRVWRYEITIVETEHRLANGLAYKVWAFGGTVPGPLLVAREGDLVRIHVTNETSVAHTLHSHGLFVPQRMDGVPHQHGAHAGRHGPGPGATLPQAIAPGEGFTYEYVARPAGSHFYHCHVNANEHMGRGMAGALIVLPRNPEPGADRDQVLLLQEWDSRYARGGPLGDPREASRADFFTINGLSYPHTPTIDLEPGDICRLRLINAGGQSHAIHLHGHTFLVTHKDGTPLAEPLEMDTVGVGPGERADLVFVANNRGEWPLHCHAPTHQTNAGQYPGGMMTHVLVGPEPSPAENAGPEGPATADLRMVWRRSALARLYPKR